MNVIEKLHKEVVQNRRARILAMGIAGLLPKSSQVLDVGCGNGLIGALIMKQRPDVSITGIEVLIRNQSYIPLIPFDGGQIPYASKTFDSVILIDVLHHTEQPDALLEEAKRVSKGVIVLKDHTKEGFLAGVTLRFMDWVGNAHHGVSLPYNYWTENKWRQAFSRLHLKVESWNTQIGLYPFPANLFFDRSLHFIAKLKHD